MSDAEHTELEDILAVLSDDIESWNRGDAAEPSAGAYAIALRAFLKRGYHRGRADRREGARGGTEGPT